MNIAGFNIEQSLVWAFVGVILVLSFVLFMVLFLTYFERKVLGHFQLRLGPMRVGFHGALQAPADAIKLMVKEDLIPDCADNRVYRFAPYVVFVPTFLVFMVIPFARDWVVANLDLGLFFIVAVPGLSIVGLFMAGWSSDNKYALLGAVRSVAQMVSYELPLVVSILGVAILAETLSLSKIVDMQSTVPYLFLQPIGFLIFLISSLAELNRTPFDIPVAESEVVGGPHIEYSGMRWGIFYLAEYGNTFATAAICATVFLGGWAWPLLPGFVWFLIKTYVVILLIFWLRATLPRLRIDQLMGFAWKFLLPLSFVNLLLTAMYMLYGWPALAISLVVTAGIIYWGVSLWQSHSTRRPAPLKRPTTVRLVEAAGGDGK
ncbi:MAG: NADH-quinone oxidoreductase subunit NuoH [Dehalococcoidia bacterium]|nr:NADH-quinone oxidoreductase subunit NuoH [Dehalococcoidia bacterium]